MKSYQISDAHSAILKHHAKKRRIKESKLLEELIVQLSS
jgi:hypothetical protein